MIKSFLRVAFIVLVCAQIPIFCVDGLTDEQKILKEVIDQVPLQAYEFLETLKHSSPETQSGIMNILYILVVPHDGLQTQDDVTNLQKNLFDLINSSTEIQTVFNQFTQKTQTESLSPYLEYLEQIFEVAKTKTQSSTDLLEVQKILMQKAIGIEHMITSIYYDTAYNHFKQVNQAALIATVDNLGNQIPLEDRINQLPSMPDIQTLLLNLQRKANALDYAPLAQ